MHDDHVSQKKREKQLNEAIERGSREEIDIALAHYESLGTETWDHEEQQFGPPTQQAVSSSFAYNLNSSSRASIATVTTLVNKVVDSKMASERSLYQAQQQPQSKVTDTFSKETMIELLNRSSDALMKQQNENNSHVTKTIEIAIVTATAPYKETAIQDAKARAADAEARAEESKARAEESRQRAKIERYKMKLEYRRLELESKRLEKQDSDKALVASEDKVKELQRKIEKDHEKRIDDLQSHVKRARKDEQKRIDVNQGFSLDLLSVSHGNRVVDDKNK